MIKPVFSTSRYVGGWPKIGIRTAIDGRRNGVRESLEGQTMGLARAAAEFISANLRYPDGTPVECVIPDDCIGGVVEAARAKRSSFSWTSLGMAPSPASCTSRP